MGILCISSAIEITGEKMTYSINGRFILTKNVSSLLFIIYKNKIQTDWRLEHRKQNSIWWK